MTTAEQIVSVAEELGLSMGAEFIPFSKSRNAGEKQPSLNWKVSIFHTTKSRPREAHPARLVIQTDYMAGCAHCPSYQASVQELGGRNCIMRDEAIRGECETGKHYRRGTPISPNITDVLASLVSDADAIDRGGFEEWASDLGYDTDSRKAETIYRACVEIGLKLRNALGEAGLARLREACRDY